MAVVPSNDKTRKPTAKKEFSMSDFKKKTGSVEIADKPLEWIKIDDDLEEVTGIPGIAKGYVNMVRGYTNTGKSTAAMKAAVNAQKMGILPIIIDTENNIGLGNERLKLMGFDWDNEFFMLVDNVYLLEHYGWAQDKNRLEASIEDMARFMQHIIRMQADGELPFDIIFIIDSIGTLNCIKTINALEKNDSDNNQWNAGAYEKAFMSLLNNTVPNTRKVNKEYTTTVLAVQKIWYDAMNKVIKHKGGETWHFASRLVYHFGGILTHGTKRITATSKGREVAYGTEAKVNINKNHIDGPLGGISMEGSIVSTPHGYVVASKIDTYKKKNILYFRKLFGEDGKDLNAEDIEDKVRNVTDNGEVIYREEVNLFVGKGDE